MPTYQYACTACGEQHEAVQAFSDAPLTECPACGGKLRKVFSAVGVVFKGSGFYKTDSRSAPKGGSGDAKGGSESKGDAKTSTSTGTSDASSGSSSSGGSSSESSGAKASPALSSPSTSSAGAGKPA